MKETKEQKTYRLDAIESGRVRAVCVPCGFKQELTDEQSNLLHLGLLPYRCPDCGELRSPSNTNESVKQFAKGWD